MSTNRRHQMTKDEVRDEAANKIWAMPRDPSSEVVYETIDSLLAIPEIAIVDREAELPEFNPPFHIKGTVAGDIARAWHERTQQDMLKAGWVKEAT